MKNSQSRPSVHTAALAVEGFPPVALHPLLPCEIPGRRHNQAVTVPFGSQAALAAFLARLSIVSRIPLRFR
jgi:hypothetical protein